MLILCCILLFLIGIQLHGFFRKLLVCRLVRHRKRSEDFLFSKLSAEVDDITGTADLAMEKGCTIADKGCCVT